MDMDDPTKPEFASWNSYDRFARTVRRGERYVWSAGVQAFLDTVLATRRDRDVTLKKGYIVYRAQRGIDWSMMTDDEDNEIDEEPVGYGAARMKPLPDRAMEGRANPTGIPVLYLGTTAKTAVSEVRPWMGAWVSVAQFQLQRDVTVLDLSRGHGKSSFTEVGFGHLLDQTEPDPEIRERGVWIDIDNAFSRPVTLSDDGADYVPTQILAELFRRAGYDGIAYKSQFDDAGFNIALFDVDAADAINCAPYRVTKVDIGFEESGRRWFSSRHLLRKKGEADQGSAE